MPEWTPTEDWLARAILSLADTASVPDTFWQTDGRIAYARAILEVGEDERYTKWREWDDARLYEGN